VANGRERRSYRFRNQRDLWGSTLRSVINAAASPDLRMPHLTASEIEDVWAALCGLGDVLEVRDELDQTREWLAAAYGATVPLTGYSLTRGRRHDALMELRRRGEFSVQDAREILRRPQDPWPRHPVRVEDEQTGEVWLRTGEAATYLRYIVGVDPLPHAILAARFAEIGVRRHHFQDRRPPHPKLWLYRVPEAFFDESEVSE
jgi:hypothetical protein